MQAGEEEVVDQAAVPEAHLVLGGMDVDVHHRGVHLQVEHEDRVAAAEEHVAVGLAYRMGHEAVAHHPAVDEEVLLVGLGPGVGGQPDPAPEAQAGGLEIQVQGVLQERLPQQRGDASLAAGLVVPGTQLVEGLLVVAQDPADVVAGERLTAEGLLHVAELGFLGAQELAPRRGIEEEVAHRHRGAAGVGRRADPGLHVAPLGHHPPAGGGVVIGVGGKLQPRHRADRGQGLAAKAQARHPLELLQGEDLAGGVARQGERQVLLGDAAAVVAHPDQAGAARLQLHLDARAAGVDGVLHQLLDHRGGALHHLAGGDLVGETGVEDTDAAQF